VAALQQLIVLPERDEPDPEPENAIISYHREPFIL